jgi:hypothetical protein
MTSTTKRRWTALMIACAILPAGLARAQTAAASAEALFAEGRRLMNEGKAEAACPKFAASNSLDPSSGALLNLGSCYEKLGRAASAWAAFQEAASRAQSAGRADHLRIAQKRAAALEPTLPHVTLNVPEPTEGMEIRRDGVLVTKAEWGLPMPIDPGSHKYVVTAPQHVTWTGKLEVAVDAADETAPNVTMTIPALELLPPAPETTSPAKAQPTIVTSAPYWTAHRYAAVASAAVGVIGLGVGTAFAFIANSAYDRSLSGCPRDKNLCTPEAVRERDDARTQGNIATAGFIVGGAGLAAGFLLWVTAPNGGSSEKRASMELVPSLGGMTMRGRW